MTTTRTAATIGLSRTVHTMTSAGITLCSIDKSGNLVLIHPTDAAVTCRTCLGRMASTREADHAEALMINTKVSAVVLVGLPLTTNQIADAMDTRAPRFLVEAAAHIENRRRNDHAEALAIEEFSTSDPIEAARASAEAKRLGYASVTDYLNAPGRQDPEPSR